MSKPFSLSLKIVSILITGFHYLLLILSIPSILFGIGMVGINFSFIEYVEIFLYALFLVSLLWLSIKIWRLSEEKRVLNFFVLQGVIVIIFYTTSALWYSYQYDLNEKAKVDYYQSRELFLREHCVALNDKDPHPVYRCDDGTIR